MYRFWCLLCADRKGAEIKIQSLDEVLRESIGQFSIIVSVLTFTVVCFYLREQDRSRDETDLLFFASSLSFYIGYL